MKTVRASAILLLLLCLADFLLPVKVAGQDKTPPPYQKEMPVKDSVMQINWRAQSDSATGKMVRPARIPVPDAFNGTRVINGQSVKQQTRGTLDFIILHRFGTINDGAKNFFGLDNANTRIGFEYGLKDWLTIGLGRSTFQKEYDGFIRLRLLQQTTDNHMPVTVSYAGTMMVRSDEITPPDTITKYFFSNRMSFCNQVLIARRFSARFSLQLSPTHVHYNLVRDANDANDVFAVGIAGRLRLSRRLAVTGEYFYTIPGARLHDYKNSASIGLEIETSGHMFQLHFTNPTGMTERTFIGQTSESWNDGSIHFGFNIHRVFTIVKPKGAEE